MHHRRGNLLAAAELLGLNLITPDKVSFDTASMQYAGAVGALSLLLGQIIDRLPGRFWQQIALETKVFTLRLLGRETAPLPAALVSFLTSASAAISEEIFFRGLVFNVLLGTLGPWGALAGSSAFFGLCHVPVLGGSWAVEVCV